MQSLSKTQPNSSVQPTYYTDCSGNYLPSYTLKMNVHRLQYTAQDGHQKMIRLHKVVIAKEDPLLRPLWVLVIPPQRQRNSQPTGNLNS